MCNVGNSSDGGDLSLLFKGEVLESLMEALVVGILLSHFLCFAVITFVVFVIELPSEECENP